LHSKFAITILFETLEISFSNIDMKSCEKRYWIMNRIVEILEMFRKIVMWNSWHNKKINFVLKFNDYLKKMVATNEVQMWYKKIQCIWKWFEEIRKVLRVSRELSEKGQMNSPTMANENDQELKKMI
jgi:hypothetical protein